VDDARVLDAPVGPHVLRAAAGLGRGPGEGVLASFEREQPVALLGSAVARVSHRGPPQLAGRVPPPPPPRAPASWQESHPTCSGGRWSWSARGTWANRSGARRRR